MNSLDAVTSPETPPPAARLNNTAARRERFNVLYQWTNGLLELNKSKTLLEFGVGQNGFSDFYAELCKSVYGLDINDFSSFHEGRGFEFMQYDGTTIPLPDSSIDVVATHSVLEHVSNLQHSLNEIDRVLKVSGRVYMTVSPLYYSAGGSHIRDENGSRLDNWEHLDPDSRFYLSDNPLAHSDLRGHSLNAIKMTDVLGAIGNLPWNILAMDRRYESHNKTIPAYVSVGASVSNLDLITREFRIIIRKNRKSIS